jgi:hypothetical protein
MELISQRKPTRYLYAAKNAFEEIVKDAQSDAIEVAAKVIETIVDIVT